MPRNDNRMNALPTKAPWKTELRGCCKAADKGLFLTLSCLCTGEVEAYHMQSPLPWLHGALSLSLDLALTHPEHPCPHEGECHNPGWISRIMIQTLLFLSPSSSWQPRPCSQNLWHCSPKRSVPPGRVPLKVGREEARPMVMAQTCPPGTFHHPRAAFVPFSLPWSWENPTLMPVLSRIHPSSPSLALLHTWIHFSFLFLSVFFFLFPITPLMQSRAADYKRGSLTWAIGLLH